MATREDEVIYKGEKKIVEFDAAKNGITGAYLNSLTMTFSVHDANNNLIGTADQAMDYVADSDGQYQGTISNDDTLTMEVGAIGDGSGGVYVTVKSSDGGVYRRVGYDVEYRGKK